METGTVYLIGAGPGDPGLLTIRGAELLGRADVIVYDALVNQDILSLASTDAEIIFGGKRSTKHAIPQEELNQLLVDKAKEGLTIVRLKGGDPYIFGRGSEEAQELQSAGIPFEIIPGISSFIAAPAYAGIPVTHRDHCSSFTVITGHEKPDKDESSIDWENLANETGTRVILMGVDRIRLITERLQANGIADDFLTSMHLVTRAPILMAPAMNSNMWGHVAVERNLEILRGRGVRFVEPTEGDLACGWTGPGRLAEPSSIVTAVEESLRPRGSLLGRCLLITAGPTYEDLDPVRFLGNRSTGRMGRALAQAAIRRGARVILVAGPTSLEMPAGVEVVRVRSASEMYRSVMERKTEAGAMILAAAVADYTPTNGPRSQKLCKDQHLETIKLTRTLDILADLGAWRAGQSSPLLVGFAAETEEMLVHARAKLKAKNVDLIVANNVSQPDTGFGVDTNAVTLVSHDVETSVPLQAKNEIAEVILDRVEELLQGREADGPQRVLSETAHRNSPS